MAALMLAVVPASAAEGDMDALIRDCSHPGLSGMQRDACLERVRVFEETTPSPKLQSLEAQLESADRPAESRPGSRAQPSMRDRAQTAELPPPETPRGLRDGAAEPDGPATAQPRSLQGGTTAMETEHRASPPQDDPEGDTQLFGPDVDDEPPVADPPDSMSNPMSSESDDLRPPQDDPPN